jgi:hypothetical protein
MEWAEPDCERGAGCKQKNLETNKDFEYRTPELRDFWRRSIFDFFDSIDPKRICIRIRKAARGLSDAMASLSKISS